MNRSRLTPVTVAVAAQATGLGAARQVTYVGHPPYRFVRDTRPGHANGQNSHAFGAGWYLLSPAGKKIEKDGQ